MIKNNYLSTVLCSGLLFISSFSVSAEPWIDTSDVFLRADIQLLADQGHINIPLTTYPLMWSDVGRALSMVNENSLNEEGKSAYWHVKQKLTYSKKSNQSIELNLASDESRFTSFGDTYRDANFTQGHFSYMGDNWAVKFSPSVTEDNRRSKNVRIDDSYIAGFAGNWVVSFGMQDRWYGPGWDTNLALTNNARALPAIALSRKNSTPFVMPFFNEVKIPWTVTTFMGQFEEDRHVSNTLLWGFRLNFKPTQYLELGVTRLAQWAGDDRPSGLDTFWKVIKGEDNCGGNGPSEEECNDGKEPGNQLGGYDIRYNLGGFDLPFSIYMQMNAEDGDRKGGLSFFGEERYAYGVDSRFNLFDHNWLGYIEYTDTFTDATDGNNPNLGEVGKGDFYYEHKIYKTGMRHYGRVIASIYENDAKTIVFGMVSQLNSLESWEFKARYLDLNNDNSDLYPDDPYLGNTVTKIAEEVVMLSLKYQRFQGRFKYTIGGNLAHSTFENDDESSKTEPNLFFNVEYNL